ncbi:MAG: HAD family hydrolase [Elusimicrobiota bacterium]
MSGNNFRKRNLGKDNKGKPAIFLDRDGTVIEDLSYLCDHNKVYLLPEVIPALKLLKKSGFMLILATNQSGIERKLITLEQLKKIHNRLAAILTLNDVKLDGIYFCPHHPDTKCTCRKPQPGMALWAKKKFNLDLEKSFSIGDKISDVEFAKKFSGTSVLISSSNIKKNFISGGVTPDYVAKNILDAARWIVRKRDASNKGQKAGV